MQSVFVIVTKLIASKHYFIKSFLVIFLAALVKPDLGRGSPNFAKHSSSGQCHAWFRAKSLKRTQTFFLSGFACMPEVHQGLLMQTSPSTVQAHFGKGDLFFCLMVVPPTSLGGHFGPEKQKISPPPPKNSPLHRRHPPGHSAPLRAGDPPPGIFNKRSTPAPPPPRCLGFPVPLPEQKKIKNIRNVHQEALFCDNAQTMVAVRSAEVVCTENIYILFLMLLWLSKVWALSGKENGCWKIAPASGNAPDFLLRDSTAFLSFPEGCATSDHLASRD